VPPQARTGERPVVEHANEVRLFATARFLPLVIAVGRHEAVFKQQQAVIDQLTSMEISIQQLANTQRDIVDKVNSASQSVASLNAGLANRVRENEQAVAAIDAYRVQVNTRLANIERKLDGGGGAPL